MLGGSNPYQVFSADDVTAVRMIQAPEVAGLFAERDRRAQPRISAGAKSAVRTAQVLRDQIGKLQSQRTELDAALTFLTEKLAWVEAGKPGAAPQFAC